jgi:REP element-mobilizing transposase RayT
MSEIIGYMVTWTTYGSWLPGDERGYVEDGVVLPANQKILELSKEKQKSPVVILTEEEIKIVQKIILSEAERIDNEVLALTVRSNHVHIVIRPHSQSLDKIIGRYKSMTTRALWNIGRIGRIWTKRYDKRLCLSNEQLEARINYVNKHNTSY